MRGTASVLAVAGALTAGAAHAEDITLTVWSHEADSKSKVAWRELAARNFEEAHPGVKVKITWYQKEPLFSALNTALRAGQGPDAFYIERDRVEYITNGFVTPLNDLINWSSIKDTFPAKRSQKFVGHKTIGSGIDFSLHRQVFFQSF